MPVILRFRGIKTTKKLREVIIASPFASSQIAHEIWITFQFEGQAFQLPLTKWRDVKNCWPS
jgi:hypothetical protein